jgi:glycosyltransferase involved in cell wall biosynthesis
VSQSVPASGGYCVIIPTYNNGGTVRGVVEAALAVAGAVIVVDDGCTDGTREELVDLPAVVISHKRNRGKGVALRTGFREAHRLGFTHAVTLDSDGQHFPEEIPTLAAASRENPDAVVIGARDMRGELVPKC